MKTQLLLLLGLVLTGCGSDPATEANANDLPLSADGTPLYTLETHYRFSLHGHDVIVWGMDQAFGKTNESASAYFFDTGVACGMRMIVRLAETGDNNYTMQMAASEQSQSGTGCSELSGLYSLSLTGPTTANILYIGEGAEYF